MADTDPERSPPGGGEHPTIAADRTPPQLRVTGHGFLPRHGVTIRVLDPEDTTSYFQYVADGDGDLDARLPTTLPHGTLQISATDDRPDPTDDTGRLWTNTDTLTW
ncbi:hypothetical protein FK531_14370 [Rhodococcus spelaei]|uniref:Uncharacterized protein n=1 Tax=Rhodococcus spelaei TaxID=2546320 RepID=A0A541B7I8_9NOCA|nr:hypothetical protein [Rhodococcus spelaei]TQF68289.1 hypothetical protein FK531_14370 [Rhodococcus spelaei]